jgi:hypothetical protein
MARWRAVPTAVSTAVGALAFLASTGLAIVLGAGLHVWSGPAAPTGVGSQNVPGTSSVTGRVGGVVTVPAPPASAGLPSPGSGTAPPTITLPFVPFAPVAARPAASAAAAVPTSAPTAEVPAGPGPTSLRRAGREGTGAGELQVGLRAFLAGLRALDSSTSVALVPSHPAQARHQLLVAAGDVRPGHRGQSRAVGHRHAANGHHGHGHAYPWGHHRHGRDHSAAARHHRHHRHGHWERHPHHGHRRG